MNGKTLLIIAAMAAAYYYYEQSRGGGTPPGGGTGATGDKQPPVGDGATGFLIPREWRPVPGNSGGLQQV